MDKEKKMIMMVMVMHMAEMANLSWSLEPKKKIVPETSQPVKHSTDK